MMRANPASSMQKTYDECYLTCSTAVYFENQNNEAEALRSWKRALQQIYHHYAHRVPSNYRPRTETERALHESIHQLELQCKERVDLLEALKQSREENLDSTQTSNLQPTPWGSQPASTPPVTDSARAGWLGDGTIPPAEYPDPFRPPLPQRPPSQARRNSGTMSGLANHRQLSASRPSLSPSSTAFQNKLSRTPSPEKRSMLKTLRSGGETSRSSLRIHRKATAGPPDAAKAATQAWAGPATQKPSTGKPASVHDQPLRNLASTASITASQTPLERTHSGNSIQPIALASSSRDSLVTVRRPTPPQNEIRSPSPVAEAATPNEDHFSRILKKLPSSVDRNAAEQIFNEIVIQGDEVHWDDIAGLDVAKSALKETVVYPFLRPDLFMGLREPAKGMLLFGPPGTGKTMLARAVATESKSTFFAISASSLTSKFLGESEKLVRALFAVAKMLAPSIIFVDEIDSLLSARAGSGEHEATRRIKTEFLIQWSDLAKAAAGRDQRGKNPERGDASRVLVLAATNLPWEIDEAARRRFVRRQYIPLPEANVRKTQLKTLLSHQKHSLSEEEIEQLVQLTDGFSGSDITALAKDAAMGPLRSLGEKLLETSMDEIRPIDFRDFQVSLGTIRPSVSKQGLQRFEDWAKDFGERGG